MADLTEDFIIQKCSVGNRDILFFLTFNYEVALQEVQNGQLFILKHEASWSYRDLSWTGISLSSEDVPELICFVLGRDGDVLVATKQGFHEEEIEYNGKNPLDFGPLQDINIIGHSAFAVGMGRQVYKRVGRQKWISFEAGIQDPPDDSIVGFNSISGSDEDEMYAVGWGGEIWLYRENSWTQLDSPTNLILNCVTISSNKDVFICGKSGVIIKGRFNSWNMVDYEGPVTDWITMTWFKEKLYLGDGYGLFSLDDTRLDEIIIPGEPKVPINSLSSTEDLLVATGSDCAFSTRDGVNWIRLPV